MLSSSRHIILLRRKNLINTTQRWKATASSSRRPSPGVLVGDAGPLATHAYHVINTFLIGAAPIYFLLPAPKEGEGNSTISSVFDRIFGSMLAMTLAGHSWVGMNYVATDYVPKISKSLVGPSRYLNAGMGIVTFVGMGAIVFNDKGGIKGCLSSLWKSNKKEEEERAAVTENA